MYESESYWDKEKKQPRSHRRLIGKLDNETGEIIPTGKKGRSRKNGGGPDIVLPSDTAGGRKSKLSGLPYAVDRKLQILRTTGEREIPA